MKLEHKKNCFPKLFTWKELELLINQKVYLVPERCKIDDCEIIKWPISRWDVNPNEMPPNLFYQHLENKTGVFYFRDMSKYKFQFNEICKELEEKHRRPFDTHIFVHYNNLDVPHPFGCHWDTQNNVIVQCEGETHWKVWQQINPNDYPDETGAGSLNLKSKPILDVVLKSGDALWLPQYYPHEAKSKTKRMSISFAGEEYMSVNSEDYINREWVYLF